MPASTLEPAAYTRPVYTDRLEQALANPDQHWVVLDGPQIPKRRKRCCVTYAEHGLCPACQTAAYPTELAERLSFFEEVCGGDMTEFCERTGQGGRRAQWLILEAKQHQQLSTMADELDTVDNTAMREDWMRLKARGVELTQIAVAGGLCDHTHVSRLLGLRETSPGRGNARTMDRIPYDMAVKLATGLSAYSGRPLVHYGL